MLSYLLPYLHVFGAVLLIGYTLFWVIMALALSREATPVETSRLLGVINAGRWPPGGVPYKLRLPFPALGWVFLALLAATGALLVVRLGHPAKPLVLGIKLGLFALLLVGQAIATRRPSRTIAFVNGLAALAIVVISALIRR